MNANIQIIEQFAPMTICLLAAIPVLFLYAFNKGAEKPQPANYHFLITYLICLILISIVMIVMKGIALMAVDNSDRSLFICSVLLIACIDQAINFLPLRKKLQFDLGGLLLYSIVMVCAMPLVWEISRRIISPAISNQPNIMHAAEISLMLIMVTLCIAAGFSKKLRVSKDE
jgi:hypothetical protein